MPSSETQSGPRNARLLTVVFWIGVGLAPLAVLLVLVSSGATGLRVAAVLAIVAVVLIGLSIMLRPDAASVRVEVEDMMFEELDVLREDVREDITTAARATHRAFSEKLQQLQETVEALRGQVEAARAAGFQAAKAKAAPPPAPAARPAHSQPVGTAMVAGGVVRHTETVQVTTRHTVVDPHGDGDRSGTVYSNAGGTVYGGRPEPVGARRAPEHIDDHPTDRDRRGGWSTPREESWTEQRLRERMAESREATHRDAENHDDFRSDAGRWSRPFDRDDSRSGDAGDDPRWTDVRAGDRWASVRADERGREVRVGERRAAVHNDGSGTELRIEDRWAQVRQEDAYRRGERRAPDAAFSDDSGSWSPPGGGREQRALPAPPAEPASSWTEGWRDDREREREREPVRRRRDDDDRDGRWERGEDTSRGMTRPRRPEFERNDERWR
jgi:hypothetical protein